MRSTFFCILLSLTSAGIRAQMLQFKRLQAPVSINGLGLKDPFTGGFNAPQASQADLNNDGLLDLVLFDRAGFVVMPFLNNGDQNQNPFRFAPEYACLFPVLNDYVVLRDFNKDGAVDIFCASHKAGTQEMQVYQGYYENNQLMFKPFYFSYPANCAVCNPLYIYYPDKDQSGFWNNLFIARTDVPGIDDVDGDGDLDIVAFEAGNSTSMFWMRNTSVESGFGADSLHFVLEDRCWGRIFENGMEPCRGNLSPDPKLCATPFTDPDPAEDRNNRHPGASVMLYDQEGDGDKDIVMGNINFPCLGMLTNGGTPQQAWMVAQDTTFPTYDEPVFLPIFVAGYYLDLNNDGRKDMLAAVNNPTTGEDRNNMWFYANTSATGHAFTLQTQRFLIDQTIDLGTSSHPVFVDVNADGLKDLVVGNYGYYTTGGNTVGSLYLFLNTGTPTQPAFALVDSDWLGLSEFAPDEFDFSPAFGDIDGDLDLDLVVGINLGVLYCYRNNAGPGAPMNLSRDPNPMWYDIRVGLSATPYIYDLNKDGLNDLIIGERNGNINYFENKGTLSTPLFDLLPSIQKLGDIDARVFPESVGFSIPVFIPQPDGALWLLTGTQGGQLELYSDVVTSEQPFPLVSGSWGNIDEGNRSHPTVADLNNDGLLDLVVGNRRGGLSFYETTLVDCTMTTSVPSPQTPFAIKINLWPNPAQDQVWIQTGVYESFIWNAVDMQGKRIASGLANGPAAAIQTANWPNGIYAIEVQLPKQTQTIKLLINK
ncbi:MAG: T9SS type A sorting domain-containing protein [Saprospiraceae bacterium]